MSESAGLIGSLQDRWAGGHARDPRWNGYLPTFHDNLFQKLHALSEDEFRRGDGSELTDTPKRPAKMRALVSSSALAVNFFDAWRDADKVALSEALGTPPIAGLEFEFKTKNYPVRPRSPNLDLLLRLQDGQLIAVESKFSEPYRSDDGHGALSARYFASSQTLWRDSHLDGAQELASRLQPEWIHLDAPQLLKHLLGLANDPSKPACLLYLWFDTSKPDTLVHRREIADFSKAVASDSIAFQSRTYQDVFDRVPSGSSPVDGWHAYMRERYFPATPAV